MRRVVRVIAGNAREKGPVGRNKVIKISIHSCFPLRECDVAESMSFEVDEG